MNQNATTSFSNCACFHQESSYSCHVSAESYNHVHHNHDVFTKFPPNCGCSPPKVVYSHHKSSMSTQNIKKNHRISSKINTCPPKTSKVHQICGFSPKISFPSTLGPYGKSTYSCTPFYGLIRPKHGLCTGGFAVRTLYVLYTYLVRIHKNVKTSSKTHHIAS